jgi:hypothetical protein
VMVAGGTGVQAGQGDLLSQVAFHFQQQQQQEAAMVTGLGGQKRVLESADGTGGTGLVTNDSFLVTPPDQQPPAEKKQKLSVDWEDQAMARNAGAAAEPTTCVTGVIGVTRTATLGSSGTGAACSALLGLAAGSMAGNGTATGTAGAAGGCTDSQTDEQTVGVLGAARAGSLRSGGSNELEDAALEAKANAATAAAAAGDVARQQQVPGAAACINGRMGDYRAVTGDGCVTSDRAGDNGVPRNTSHLLLQSLESGDPLPRWGSAPTAGSSIALTLARLNSGVDQQTSAGQAQSQELMGAWE